MVSGTVQNGEPVGVDATSLDFEGLLGVHHVQEEIRCLPEIDQDD